MNLTGSGNYLTLVLVIYISITGYIYGIVIGKYTCNTFPIPLYIKRKQKYSDHCDQQPPCNVGSLCQGHTKYRTICLCDEQPPKI